MNNLELPDRSEEQDVEKRAASLAISILKLLSDELLFVAVHCFLLHWFDQKILKTFLSQTKHLTEILPHDVSFIYQQLASLPFAETADNGITFNTLTRNGVLRLYAQLQPAQLINAAKMMAPICEGSEEYGSVASDAFFCYLIAGEEGAARKLLDKLLHEAVCREDWQFITAVLSLCDEAAQLLFVQPFLLSEKEWMLKGLAERIQGNYEAAIIAYRKAIESVAENVSGHMMLGAIYVDLERYEEALQEYDCVIEIDRANVQAFLHKGIVYFHRLQLENALSWFNEALARDPENLDAKIYRQQAWERLEYERSKTRPLTQELTSTPPGRWLVVIPSTFFAGVLLALAAKIVLTDTREALLILLICSIILSIASILGTLIFKIEVTSREKSLARKRAIVDQEVAGQEELDLWKTSQRYIRGDIQVEQLEEAELPHTLKFNASIFELALRSI